MILTFREWVNDETLSKILRESVNVKARTRKRRKSNRKQKEASIGRQAKVIGKIETEKEGGK